jgi:hypothetical protein
MEKKGRERMAAHRRYRVENRGAAREFDGGGKRCSALIAARTGGARGGGPMLVPAVMGCWHGGAGERVADRWAQLPPIIIQIFFK